MPGIGAPPDDLEAAAARVVERWKAGLELELAALGARFAKVPIVVVAALPREGDHFLTIAANVSNPGPLLEAAARGADAGDGFVPPRVM